MLRRARTADAAAIHALLWSAKDDIPLTDNFHTDPYRKWVEDRCAEEVVWVVLQKATVTGTMVMQGNEIFYLVVSSAHRRKGVARILLSKAKALYKNHGLRARIVPTNIPVAKLFAAEGFRCDGLDDKWLRYTWSSVG
jgi:GNAT superfamily N-acetyltransferase